MNRKKLAKKTLLAAVITYAVYFAAILAVILLQKQLKPLYHAPMGAVNTFYFPTGEFLFVSVCAVLMLALVLCILRGLGRRGALPVAGLVLFGALYPLAEKLVGFLVGKALEKTENDASTVLSIDYVQKLTGIFSPLAWIGIMLFIAGCAFAISTQGEKN